MTAALPRVTIALSTWNGAAYLPDQLESFLRQTHTAWTLAWRDDGSTDATSTIVRDFAAGAGAGRVRDLCDTSGRIGISASFLNLLRAAPSGECVAFADQDDVWLAEKLERGIAALSRVDANCPALYCARQVLVNDALAPIGESARLAEPPGFPQALTQNIATGCTVMLNPAAVRLVAKSRAPAGTLHDWWAYIVVAAAGGRVLMDEVPTVYYRQHAGNAVGVPQTYFHRAIAALRRGPGVFMRIFRGHVDALSAQPSLLSTENRKTLIRVRDGLNAAPWRRIGALRLPALKRQNFAETQLFRLWFLLG